jgi:hypothetical protein
MAEAAQKLIGLRYNARWLQSATAGAAMNRNFIKLRQRMVETALEFIQAQRAYLEAAAPLAGKSEMELKEAAEEYLRAAGPYDAALQELRQYLLATEPSEMMAMELDHTKQLIEALDRGKG